MPLSDYSIKTFTAEDEIHRIREDWDRLSLAARHPNVFTTLDWFEAWFQHFEHDSESVQLRRHVLALKSNGIVCGIVPLTCATISKYGMTLRRLQFAARSHEWDYNDLLVGNDLHLKIPVIVEHLRQSKREWDLVDLMDVRDVDNIAELIRENVSKSGLYCALLPAEERCPYMLIDSDWEDMVNRRSSATRHSLRNRASKLRRMIGEALRIRILDAPQSEAGLLERMVALEAQKQSNHVLSVPFLGQYPEVFKSVFDKLGPKGWLRVALLESDDRLLSWHLLFRCGDKLWGYLTAYDHAFGKLSPGSMLIPAIIDYGFAHDCTEYDFLSGEEPYKMQWANNFHRRYRILIWNDRWKSRLYAELFKRKRDLKVGR